MGEYTAHPVAEMFPMMSETELRALADDIAARGLLDPIVVHNGQLLDGRNRTKACRLAGVAVKVMAWDGSGGTPEGFIISHNLHRRHLTESQRAMVAADLKEHLFKEAARGRKADGQAQGGRVHRGVASASIDAQASPAPPPSRLKAAAQAAEMMNVSTASVERAVRVAKSEPLKEAVRSGDITVTCADVLTSLPKQEQEALVKDPQAAKRKASELRHADSTPAPAPEPHKTMSRKGLKMPANPLASLESLAKDVIDTWERETESDLLSEKWELASAIQREAFVKSLDDLVASTRRIKKGLNNDAPKEDKP